MRNSSRLTIALAISVIGLSQMWIESSAQASHITFSNIAQSGQGPGDPFAPYGSPTIDGNALKFSSPNSFSASSANGVMDLYNSFTDGFLSFSAKADSNSFISGFSLNETGARTLADFPLPGTDQTSVRVIALGRVIVTELDHGATPLIGPPANPIYNVDIGFNLNWNKSDNPGTSFWDGFVFKNISESLRNNGAVFTQGATAFDFILDNQLYAFSEAGTAAFIDKKRIEFVVTTVPEPGTLLMSVVAMTGMMLMCPRRRRIA